MRHFLTLNDFTKEEILDIINLAKKIKKETKSKNYFPYLKNQTLGMIFEKSSTRTRISFEVGMYQLGGHALFLPSNDLQLGRGEPIKDTSRVISGMTDMIMMRTYSQDVLEEFAKYSQVPVINGLTDTFHPMQLLADYLTMTEFKKDNNPVVAYIGDGNNMCHSWMILACKLGFALNIATPDNYRPNEKIIALVKEGKINYFNDPKLAVKDADVVTTDTWISMGQEDEKEKRIQDFKGFMVNKKLMNFAKKDAIFLHCLPAYREFEVSDEVFEEHENEIFTEAQNRLHSQKAVMVWLNTQKKNKK